MNTYTVTSHPGHTLDRLVAMLARRDLTVKIVDETADGGTIETPSGSLPLRVGPYSISPVIADPE